MTHPLQIFRFNFTPHMVDELYTFSKVHQYDDRVTFKEEWNSWVLLNIEMINRETEILKAAGYIGNVIDKMYKSVRYYFRKKPTTKSEPKKRCLYISLSPEILNLMNTHIYSLINTKEYTPAIGYDSFCSLHQVCIKKELTYLCTKTKDITYIQNKFKKTYKNRYFIISRNNTDDSLDIKLTDNV